MSNLLMLYASMTGNTEQMAEIIEAYLKAKNHKVVIKTFEFDPIDVEELLDYDGILIGTYTWDDGTLPYEVEDFYEELAHIDIKGKIVGVFGSADSFYETYGGAVDLMVDHLTDLGAELVPEKLVVDLTPDKADARRCEHFAEKICKMVESNLS